MKYEKEFYGNNKPNKIVIQGGSLFDLTLYNTHIVITDDGVRILNVYAQTLIASKAQKNKSALEIPVCGNNISVKIETNYNMPLIINIK